MKRLSHSVKYKVCRQTKNHWICTISFEMINIFLINRIQLLWSCRFSLHAEMRNIIEVISLSSCNYNCNKNTKFLNDYKQKFLKLQLKIYNYVEWYKNNRIIKIWEHSVFETACKNILFRLFCLLFKWRLFFSTNLRSLVQ